MPLPFRKITPKIARMPAHIHALRLESSPLYIRREREHANTAHEARLKALWYLDASFKPRYEEVK